MSLSFAPAALGPADASLTIETLGAADTVVELHGAGYLTLRVVVPSGSNGLPSDGSITDDNGLISCPTVCAARITTPGAAHVVLTENVAPPSVDGFRFRGWGGACAPYSTKPTCAIDLTQDTTVIAEVPWTVG